MHVEKIVDSKAFWILMDQMLDARCEFFCNRVSLLDAFVGGTLYTAIITETDALFRDHQRRSKFADLLECQGGARLALPCFCVAKHGKCDFLWIRKDLRRLGVGSLFVRTLSIRVTSTRQLEGSVPFWRAHGVCDELGTQKRRRRSPRLSELD